MKMADNTLLLSLVIAALFICLTAVGVACHRSTFSTVVCSTLIAVIIAIVAYMLVSANPYKFQGTEWVTVDVMEALDQHDRDIIDTRDGQLLIYYDFYYKSPSFSGLTGTGVKDIHRARTFWYAGGAALCIGVIALALPSWSARKEE